MAYVSRGTKLQTTRIQKLHLIINQNKGRGTYGQTFFFIYLAGLNNLPCDFTSLGPSHLLAMEFRNASTSGTIKSQMAKRSVTESRTMLNFRCYH